MVWFSIISESEFTLIRTHGATSQTTLSVCLSLGARSAFCDAWSAAPLGLMRIFTTWFFCRPHSSEKLLVCWRTRRDPDATDFAGTVGGELVGGGAQPRNFALEGSVVAATVVASILPSYLEIILLYNSFPMLIGVNVVYIYRYRKHSHININITRNCQITDIQNFYFVQTANIGRFSITLRSDFTPPHTLRFKKFWKKYLK